jgi:rhodanese-related sulfurtransferase
MQKQALREAVIILVVATVIGLVVYAARPDKIPPSSAVNASGQHAPTDQDTGGGEISIDEAFDLHQANKAIFVDARHAVDYAAGHIKGAIHLSVDESASRLTDFIAATDPQAVIIAYCDGENCHLAPELAQLLFFNGFDHVFYLENGWTRWRQRALPVE